MKQPNTIVRDDAVLAQALALAKGSYQRGLLLGEQAWSGADLRGKARKFGGRYVQSRRSLTNRLYDARLPYSFETGKHGKIILVIG